MKEKDFKFYVPVEFYKSESADEEALDSWKIRGVASTGDMDYQGETVDQDGLDITILKAGRGVFNHDHQPGPENILGEIEDADFIVHEGKKMLTVEGYLFKHQPKAQGYYNIMRSLRKGSAPRVHYSIEGKILSRDNDDVSIVRKARISKVALTLDPVNPYTFADLVKSLNAPEETVTTDESDLNKAVEAGADTGAPSERSGGSVLVKESLDRKKVSNGAKKCKQSKKVAEQVLKSTIASLSAMHPEADQLELTKAICESFQNKIKELANDD